MALDSSDSAEAELALLKIATDTTVDADLADRCGESSLISGLVAAR